MQFKKTVLQTLVWVVSSAPVFTRVNFGGNPGISPGLLYQGGNDGSGEYLFHREPVRTIFYNLQADKLEDRRQKIRGA